MRRDRWILVLSVVFGLLAWTFDAVADALVFYDGSFVDLLIAAPPPHEIFVRTIILATFLAFGLVVSKTYSTLLAEREHNRRLSEYRRILSAVNQRLVRTDGSGHILPGVIDDVESGDRFEAAVIELEDATREIVLGPESRLGESAVSAVHTTEYVDAVFDRGVHQVDDVTDEIPDGSGVEGAFGPVLGTAITNDDDRFGVLTVFLSPGETVLDEDVDILTEMAADLGFFLRNRSIERDRRRFKEIVERIEDPMMFQDRDGTFQVVNEAVSAYGRRSVAELIGTDEFLFMDDETAATIQDKKREVLAEERPVEYEVTPTLPDRGERTFSTTRYPLETEDGSVEGTVAICRDVTEARERERQLERYKQAVESSMEMLAAADLDGGFLFANRRYRAFHGLDPDVDLTGVPLDEVVSADQFDAIEPRRDRALDGEIVSFETTRTDENGDKRTLAVQYYPLKTDDGSIVGNAAAMQDVTDRKERERQLETLISNLPGLVYRCYNERGWPMEMVRGRSEELVGYPADSIESGDVSWGSDVIHPDDRETVWNRIQEHLERDEPFTLTYRVRTAAGEERWVWEQGRAVRPVGMQSTVLEGFITDITDRKRLEEDLRETRDRYQSLFNSIQDAILVADTDHRIVNCNPAFTELFGHELSDIEGKRTAVIYESRSEYEHMKDQLGDHKDDPRFRYTANYRKRSGQVFPGETNVFGLRDANDDLVGYIYLVRDVSAQKRQDRQLKVIDRVLRHNINNDMNVITGSAESIAEIGGDDLDPYVENVTATAEKLLDTVQKERAVTDMLLESPDPEPIDIALVVEGIVADARDRYPDAEITATLPDEAQVTSCPRIDQAIGELVENALVHSDRDRPVIEVSVEPGDDTVAVSVADDGPGIPDMERNVLAAEGDIEPLHHGSGLGLWLVALIVEQSDGVLEFDDVDPRGSQVTVVLPTA